MIRRRHATVHGRVFVHKFPRAFSGELLSFGLVRFGKSHPYSLFNSPKPVGEAFWETTCNPLYCPWGQVSLLYSLCKGESVREKKEQLTLTQPGHIDYRNPRQCYHSEEWLLSTGPFLLVMNGSFHSYRQINQNGHNYSP